VPVPKGLDPLGRISFDKADIRVRQVEAEEVDLLPRAADHRHRLAEIDLGVTGLMGQRHEHLLRPGTMLVHIRLHRRVAAGIAVLGAQAIEDALGRVPLLRRRGAICRQDLVDNGREGAELGAGWRLAAPVARRHREGQHLASGIAVDPEAPRRLALAQTLDMAGMANPSVELHREHPRPLQPAAYEPKEGNDPVPFCTGADQTIRPPQWHTFAVPRSPGGGDP
jgi:hypothetical protein